MTAPTNTSPPDADSLGELLDRVQLFDLTVQYADAIDRRDWDRLRTCFTADAVLDLHLPGSAALHGPDAIVGSLRDVVAPLTSTQHFVSNQLFTLAGDEATGRCYLQAQHTKRDLPEGRRYMVGATYHDRYKKLDGVWRIAEREAESSWASGNRAVLFGPHADENRSKVLGNED
jgi:ketosteroid isomerase-like protein